MTASSYLCCGHCKALLLEAKTNIFFYQQSETSVHIGLKPERLPLVKRDGLVKIEAVTGNKWKSADAKCSKCGGELGAEYSIGPQKAKIIAFGRDHIALCGVSF